MWFTAMTTHDVILILEKDIKGSYFTNTPSWVHRSLMDVILNYAVTVQVSMLVLLFAIKPVRSFSFLSENDAVTHFNTYLTLDFLHVQHTITPLTMFFCML